MTNENKQPLTLADIDAVIMVHDAQLTERTRRGEHVVFQARVSNTLHELRGRLKQAHAALEFYGDEKMYPKGVYTGRINLEGGERARRAMRIILS